MAPSRPLAKRRLEAAIERALGSTEAESFSLYGLRTKLSVLTQEKRFLLFLFLMKQEGYLSSQELADAVRDQHSNVLRNLNALLSERIVIADRDPTTGIVRFAIAGAQDHASHPADGDHADANLADEMTGGTRASTHSSGPEITI
jgi:hypothetical protein